MSNHDELSRPSPGTGSRALVLGAGFGTRLLPLTEHVPKPVIPLLGRPLIGHPLIHLYASGCHEAWVNAHHRPERLSATLDPWVQRRLQRMTVHYSVETPEILGTAGAIRLLEQPLSETNEPFLMLNGDSLLGMDLEVLLAIHRVNRAEGALATLLCIERPDAAKYGAVVSVDSAGRILDFGGLGGRPETTQDELAACTPTVFCGVHVIEPSIIPHLPPRGTFGCIVRQGYVPLLAAGADVRAVILPTETPFHDVGTPARYLDAQAALLRHEATLPVGTGVDPKEAIFQEAVYAVDADGREYGSPDSVSGLAQARLEPPFFFGPRNTVEAGAQIGPDASIGAMNVIGAGAKVRDAALWAQVEVGSGERLEGVIGARLAGERVIVDGRPA